MMLQNHWAATVPTQARDAAKGVLILIVILDHNDFIRFLVPELYKPVTFHVLGFFFLAFLQPSRTPLNGALARDRVVRYLGPFLIFFALYAALYWGLYRRGEPLSAVAVDMAVGLAVASAATLKDATGFLMLWFLPAFFSTFVLMTAYDHSGPRGRILILTSALAAHLLVGMLPSWARHLVPYGLHIALYVVPLALFARWRHTRFGGAPEGWFWSICFALAYWHCIASGRTIEVATLVLPTVFEPGLFLATDVMGVAFTLALLHWAPLLARIPFLALLGRHSLVVYLVHPLVFKILTMAVPPELAARAGASGQAAVGVAALLVTAATSLTVARVIDATPALRRVVTPRDWRDWGAARCT